jgi:hypothetical protein
VDHVDLGHSSEAVQVGLELTQAGLSRFESFGGLVALREKSRWVPHSLLWGGKRGSP